MYGFLMDLLMGSVAGYGVHHYRNFWLYRTQRFTEATPFDGVLYQVGQSEIIKREGSPNATRTVICFPGFLENQHYFTELYQDADVEFVAVNNADYYSGFYTRKTMTPAWGQTNPFPVSTIEHDAHLLCEVIEHLATHQDILLHGHSRGGAVILEAACQRPDLAGKVTALLEAPVLPKAKAAKGLERFVKFGGLYIFPLYMAVMRILPTHRMINERSHYPLTPRKHELLAKTPHLPRHYSTAIGNMLNIRDWQRKSEFSVYDHFHEIRIVLPERDSVLCRESMHYSASQADHIHIIETRETNHFISLEQPQTMLAAAGLLNTSTPVRSETAASPEPA